MNKHTLNGVFLMADVQKYQIPSFPHALFLNSRKVALQSQCVEVM
jgi:hypothetical protein